MRLSGYVDRERCEGVVLSERVEANVPLEQIAAARLGSLDVLPMPAAMRLFFEPPSQDCVSPWNFYATINLRREDGGAPVRFDGLARYDSISALVEFVLRRIDPAGDGPLSMALASASAQGGGARGALERSLMSEPRRRSPPHHHHYRSRPPERRHWPIVSVAEFDDSLRSVDGVCGGRLLVPSTEGYLLGPVLAREVDIDVSGRRIPRLAYVLAVNCGLRGDLDGEPNPLVAFDGQAHRWAGSISDLPPAEIDALDREGTVYRRSLHDLLPTPHLRARCLIELPPRDSLASALGSSASPPRARQRLLDRPGYVLDSRGPVELPHDLPIIDEPEEVAFVLARTTKGIFVPRDRAAAGFPAARLPDGRHVLVLADVREDLFPCG